MRAWPCGTAPLEFMHGATDKPWSILGTSSSTGVLGVSWHGCFEYLIRKRNYCCQSIEPILLWLHQTVLLYVIFQDSITMILTASKTSCRAHLSALPVFSVQRSWLSAASFLLCTSFHGHQVVVLKELCLGHANFPWQKQKECLACWLARSIDPRLAGLPV